MAVTDPYRSRGFFFNAVLTIVSTWDGITAPGSDLIGRGSTATIALTRSAVDCAASQHG